MALHPLRVGELLAPVGLHEVWDGPMSWIVVLIVVALTGLSVALLRWSP